MEKSMGHGAESFFHAPCSTLHVKMIEFET